MEKVQTPGTSLAAYPTIAWDEIYGIWSIPCMTWQHEDGVEGVDRSGAAIDTTTPAGKLIFGIFAALAEFERELITERTRAGLAAARARGHAGGRPYSMTPAKVRLAMAAMGKPETDVAALCAELAFLGKRCIGM